MRSRRWNQPSLGARLAAYAGLAFMHLPVLVIILYAFTTADRTYEFPPPGLTLHWFAAAFARADIWEAMRLSLSVAAVDSARLADGTRHGTRQLPRQRKHHGAARTADRASRHHHGHRAAHSDQERADRSGLLDDRRGPRDVLHRHRLQQRGCAPASHAAKLDRSVDGSRR